MRTNVILKHIGKEFFGFVLHSLRKQKTGFLSMLPGYVIKGFDVI